MVPSYRTEVSVLAARSFSELDAAIGPWLASELVANNDLGKLEIQRSSMSAGSSHYTLTNNGIPSFHIYLRALSLRDTVIQLVVLRDEPTENLYGQLAAFWEWHKQERQEARQLPNIEQGDVKHASLRSLIPATSPRKRRGPKPDPHNEWARQQARLGGTIDELLPQYMELRGEEYNNPVSRVKARERLRKTIERSRD